MMYIYGNGIYGNRTSGRGGGGGGEGECTEYCKFHHLVALQICGKSF